MPLSTHRTHSRYSPPPAAILHRTLANAKVTKMQPNRQSSRAALNGSNLQQTPREADCYRPNYDYTPRRDRRERYRDYGEEEYEGYGGRGYYDWREEEYRRYGGREYDRFDEAGYYYGEPGGRSWAAQSGYGRYDGYSYDDGYYRDEWRSPSYRPLQPQVPQQAQYYQQSPDRGPISGSQTGYHRGVYPAAPASQGYNQGIYPESYYGQHRAYSPSYQYPPAWQQKTGYVSNQANSFHQPLSYGYRQQQDLIRHANAADDLDPHAPIFQPRDATRAPPTAIRYIPQPSPRQGNRRTPTSPPQPEDHPHLHILQRPNPSPNYLKNAAEPIQTLAAPRKLLIILDLNGTLLKRRGRGGFTFDARPKVNRFIDYLLANHHVMVWSSARPENVKPMCEQLFTAEQHAQLVGIWARDTLRIPKHAYGSKVQVYKQLSWVWGKKEIKAKNAEHATQPWNQANTVLIDDSVEKAASEPYNLIRLEEFENRPDQLECDVLGQVVKYLEEVKVQRDVSGYMRVAPFAYREEDEVFDWNV